MRRGILVVLCLLLATPAVAQESGKFRPGSLGGRNKNHVPTPLPGPDDIIITELITHSSAVNASSFTTSGTMSVPVNTVGYCFVLSRLASSLVTPTLTQTGQTWTRVTTTDVEPVTYATIASATRGLYLFRSLGAGAAAASLVTDFGGTNMEAYALACYAAQRVKLTGTNGADSIQQAIGVRNDSASTATVTLSALQTEGAVLMAGGTGGARTWAAEASYASGTELSVESTELRVQWHLGNGITDATPTWTFSSATNNAGIAIELVPASTGDSVAPNCVIDTPTEAQTHQVSTAAGFVVSGTCTDAVGVADDYSIGCVGCAATGSISGGTGTSTTWSVTASTLSCSAGAGTLNTFTMTGRDAATNAGTDVLAVTCINPDTIDPTVQITDPTINESFTTATAAQTIRGIAADETSFGSVLWECTVGVCTPDSGTATGTTSWNFNVTLPCDANGETVTISVTARDSSNNDSTPDTVQATCTTLDSTDPVVTITSDCGSGAGANCTVTGLPITIAGTFTDAASGVASISASCTNASPTNPPVQGLGQWSFPLNGVSSGSAAVCTVTGLDNAGNDATDSVTVTYIADLAITTTTLSALTEDEAGQTRCVTATGGVAPYTWSISAGALPTGMSLAGSTTNTECFNGTPSTAQTVTPTFRVEDSQGSPDSHTQQISVTVNAAGGETSHSYFDYQTDNRSACSGVVTTNCIVQVTGCSGDNGGCSLRSHSQLVSLGSGADAGQAEERTYHYIYGQGAETYGDPQDAAKVVIPATNSDIAIGEYLNLNFTEITSGRITVVMDEWHGLEWRQNNCLGGANGAGTRREHKSYAINGATLIGNIHRSYSEAGSATFNFPCSQNVVAIASFRGNLGPITASTATSVVTPAQIGLTRENPYLAPFGRYGYVTSGVGSIRSYPIIGAKWTRHIIDIELNVPANDARLSDWRADCDPSGTGSTDTTCAAMLATIPDPDANSTWHLYSYYLCDEDRPCRPILWKVPFHNSYVNTGVVQSPNQFQVRIDSSQTSGQLSGTVASTMYVRNVVIIKNIADADLDSDDCPFKGGSTCAGDSGSVNSNLLRKPVR